MGVEIIVGVASEVITLTEAKAHLRVTHSGEDAWITAAIAAVRERAEHRTARSIGTQTVRLTLPEFPSGAAPIAISRPPLVSVSAVKYLDTTGTEQTIASGSYRIDRSALRALLRPAIGATWPATQRDADEPVAGAVTIDYVAGYTALTLPASLRSWMLLALGDAFENREGTNVGNIVTPMQFADGFLAPHVVPEVG